MKGDLISYPASNTMFYIVIDPRRKRCPVVLYCSNGCVELSFRVEDINCIANFNLETDTRLTVNNKCGIFNIYWDETHITVDGADHDGTKEPLVIVVRNTSEVMESLKGCLEYWKKTVKDLDRA